MTLYYSPSTGGFYDDGIHSSIPDDKVQVTTEEHQALFAGQAEGKVIVAGQDGVPTLSDPPPLSTDRAWEEMRSRRDVVLSTSDWLIRRHHDQQDAGTDTTLTPQQFTSFLAYRQSLRDLPANTQDPHNVVWPASPA